MHKPSFFSATFKIRIYNYRVDLKQPSHRPHSMLNSAPRSFFGRFIPRCGIRGLQKGVQNSKNESLRPVNREVRVLQSNFESRPISRLKYDPANAETDFTDFGVLPYFQQRVNELFGAKKDENLRPTVDQRALFSILGSGHHLLLRSNVLSGKTLSLILHALSISLTRIPAFGSIRRKPVESVDTVIVVPSDGMVEKYRFYVAQLLSEVPENCCPERLVKENEDYEVTRRAFEADFLYGNGKIKHLLTRGETHLDRPHMVVGTVSQIHRVIGKDRFAEARFLAFDDADFSLNNTGSWPFNHVKVLRKGRYKSRAELIIKELQELQTRRYQENLKLRLKRIEDDYVNEHAGMVRGFKHAEYVFSNNDLSTTLVPELQQKHASMDGALMRKLIKNKRMLLYKPMQYAFICQPVPPAQILLSKMLDMPQKEKKIASKKKTTALKEKPTVLRQKLEKEMEQRAAERKEDFQLARIEKLVRFDDDMKQVRKQERVLFAVGEYSWEQFGTKQETNEKFAKTSLFPLDVIYAKRKSKLFSLNLKTKFPDDVYLALQTYALPKVNVKNLTKSYLKTRMLFGRHLTPKEYAERLKSVLFTYREEQPFDRHASLIIVPPYVDLERVRKYINDQRIRWNDRAMTWKSYRKKEGIDFHALQRHFSDQDPKAKTDRINLIVHPDQVVGQTYFGVTNIMAVGIETLVPQLAFSQYDRSRLGNTVGHISGIEGTHQELLSYYLRKLHSSNSPGTKTQLLVLMNRANASLSETSHGELDRSMFVQILLHNDIVPHIEPSMLVASLGGNVLYTMDPLFWDNLKIMQERKNGKVNNFKKELLPQSLLMEAGEEGSRLSLEEDLGAVEEGWGNDDEEELRPSGR